MSLETNKMKISSENLQESTDPPISNENLHIGPDVGVKQAAGGKGGADWAPVCVLSRAVNMEPSHYTNASFHSHSFYSLEEEEERKERESEKKICSLSS